MITTHGRGGGRINWFLILYTVLVFYYIPKFIGYLNPETHHFLKEEECSKMLGLLKLTFFE
jgi:hypothetical protein